MAIVRPTSPPFDGSLSPQPQPQSKRDVKRNRILEKLQGMINNFASNQNQHYRAQLLGVQVDMTMVLRADPYGTEGPLEDEHQEIRAMAESIMKGDATGNGGINLPDDEAAQNDFWSIVGKRYSQFVRDVNDAVEERDSELAALHGNYASSLAELDRLYQQRLYQAEEEHKALSATIRQRLTTTLNKKRQMLLRDKEQLDITDSNAMLLHPNHFSIGNHPGSPSHNGGGVSGKRTRHLRHHRGASPAPAGAETDNGKRKRKLGQVDDDQTGNESPFPTGGRSPFKESRQQAEYAQFEAPAYSIDTLFTEKELALATETAKIAAYKYFHQPPVDGSNANGTGAPSLDGEGGDSVGDELMPDANGKDTPPPGQATSAGMERTTSHQVLTRGGARANPLAALSDLANAAAAASSTSSAHSLVRPNPFTPVAPSFHAITRNEKSGAPTPPAIAHLDVESDFEMMRRAGADHPDQRDDAAAAAANLDPAAAEEAREMRARLLDQALGEPGVRAPFRIPQLEPGPGALIGRGVDREPRTNFAPALLPIPPTSAPASTSTANANTTTNPGNNNGNSIGHALAESRLRGSAALGLAGSAGSLAAALGGRYAAGEPMSRTTSAGGLSEPGDPPVGLRRGRAR